jgi:spore germination protein YaaH
MPNHGQYFAQFSEGDVVHMAWFEERRSLEEKLILMEYLDLAGVAGWRRGLESEYVWELIRRYTS